MNTLREFFSSGPFMPHGHCYFWSENLIALHALSDAFIVLAYYSIPFTLLYFVRRRRDIEFHWMFVCFAVFILACGTTHLMEIWNIWHAHYWLAGGIKAITALASVPTSILLVKLVPQALALPSASQLHQANAALQTEIIERKRITARLIETNENLEARVKERTAELAKTVESLRKSETQLHTIIENLSEGVVVSDLDGQILHLNRAAVDLHGFTSPAEGRRGLPEFAGMFALAGMDGAEWPAEQWPLARILRGEKLRDVEARIRHLQTDWRKIFSYGGTLVHNAAGESLLAIVTVSDITERKRNEEATRESQQLLRAIADNSNAVIYVKDLQGRYLLVNRRYEDIFHMASDAIVGKTDHDLFPKEVADAFRTMDQRVAAAGQALTEEETVPQADGLHTYLSVKSVLRDTIGGVCAVFGISTDITEWKIREEQLKASLKEIGDLKAALDEHAIVAITDPQGKITYVNDKFCAISKYAREELLGRDHRIINSGHHPKQFIHNLWATISRGQVWHGEIKNKAKDGSFYWVDTTIVPSLNQAGKPRQYVAIRADITERKVAEEKLRSSTKEVIDLKAALDEHAIVAITDPSGKITYVNDKFCTISKYSREELLGQDHRIINSAYHPKEFIRDLWTTISHGRVWHGEIRNKAKDGTYYWVETTIVPFLNEDGKPHQYVAIRADITTRKAAEETIRQLNSDLERRVHERTLQLEAANRELEAFSYSVSHDLRAPLRAVDGFSQAVMEDYGPLLPDEGKRYLQTIRSSAQHMGALIDDLLAFSRLSRLPLNKQTVNTAGLVNESFEDLRAMRDHRQIEIRTGELPLCEGDPILLKQVWLNLISNALKYTGKRTPAIVEIGCQNENGVPVFFIRDNGTGFDMRYVGKLFGVFQRLHRAEEYEGTGVGLAIVQRVIQRHGGRVWAEAQPDRGATFYFTLKEPNHE